MLKVPPRLNSGLDPAAFREGMRRVPGAVHVVATDGARGRAGFTATAVTPVTDSPPSLLVCVNSSGHAVKSLLAHGLFSVNTLSSEDAAVAEAFAGRTQLSGAERFGVGTWEATATGMPRLTTGLVAFDCRVSDERLVATHHVIIGEIVGVTLGDGRSPLIYQERRYHHL